MAEGNDCPECGANIGMGPVLKAPTPNRIYCPECSVRLRYGGTNWLIAAMVASTITLTLLSVAVGYVVGEHMGDELSDVAIAVACGVAILVVGAAALEVVFVSILWYGSYRLEPVHRRFRVR